MHASSLKAKPIAIVVPLEATLARLAAAVHGGSGGSGGGGPADWVRSPAIRDRVLAELQATGRAGGLRGAEIVEAVVLVGEEWSPANGLTTSAQKLNRRAILERYAREVEAALGGVP